LRVTTHRLGNPAIGNILSEQLKNVKF
jgi:hypothetical protein